MTRWMVAAFAALLAVAAQAKDPAESERAADVLGGQGRGTGSGKDSTDHTVGEGKAPAQARSKEERQGRRPARGQPVDPDMARAGGAQAGADAGGTTGGAPAGAKPEHGDAKGGPGSDGQR